MKSNLYLRYSSWVAGAVMVLLISAPYGCAELTGDLDGDGYVNEADLTLVAEHWLEDGVAGCLGDADEDCDVDSLDFAKVAQNWLKNKFITATASSQESPELNAPMAVDGNFATRWSSTFADNQWLQLDLGYKRNVRGLEIYWETAYSDEYEIAVSENKANWIVVYSTNSGDGGYDNINFSERSARYIRINCISRATSWGNSMYEVFVKSDDIWTLVWQDEFDSFDPTRWRKATHTWDDNLAQFVPENVTFQNGTMRLHLTDQQTAERDYAGAEYRTINMYRYGKFVVRMKAAPGSGIVSSFFTYRAPPEPVWNEIDIEFLGKNTNQIHFNHWWDEWPNCSPVTFTLDYAADVEFHEYSIEWRPHYIKWAVDGNTVYVATEDIPIYPQQVMMNIWISDNVPWAGPFNPSVLPVYAEYDYVRYYQKNY